MADSRRSIPNPFRRRQPPPPVPVLPRDEPDPLISPEPRPPEKGNSEEQQPRGFRRRRTTLPRNTRGWSRAIVWSLIGLTGFSVIYGLVARIETSINANGKLRPVGGVHSVIAPFNAPVQQVLVREGQAVRKGQPLIQLREVAIKEQRSRLESQQSLWRKETNLLALQLGLPALPPTSPEARRELEVETSEVALRQEAAIRELARARVNQTQQAIDLEAMRKKLAINENISARMHKLVREGAMSRLELDRQKERQIELLGAIRRTEQELESARLRVGESELKKRQILTGNLKEIYVQYDNARSQLTDVEARLDDLNDRLLLGKLIAPIDGVVFDLQVKAGEIVSPARPALLLVPQGKLEAELQVSNKDIGFLDVGMPVEIRVTSFPFTDYGSIKGTLRRLGADAKEPDALNPQEHFTTMVSIDRSVLSRDGTTYPLRPGMAVTALIQLGSRPVISLISDRFGMFMESTRTIR
ncbi:MAG: HlyD family efflux transporter periplasmic adaptor subunit [Cyanobacteriota bacterium]|jgi:hemolysin D